MKMGLVYCDYISTVSETYAYEIQTPEYGYGMEGILRSRAHRLKGIVNGIDFVANNPATDKHIVKHFDAEHPEGKAENKRALQERLGLEHGKKNILFFGLIRTYKGLDILLEAFGMLPEDYQLVVAGEPYGSFDKYQEIIDRLPGKDRIHLNLKYIKDSEVSDWFSVADIAVLPYRSATQSGISSVSYHFEVPMIVTDVGGLKETIGDRGTGLVAPEGTPECICQEIQRYFSDPEIGRECIANIRLEKERLSWKTFAVKLEEFISKL
jgi:glycogen synthase